MLNKTVPLMNEYYSYQNTLAFHPKITSHFTLLLIIFVSLLIDRNDRSLICPLTTLLALTQHKQPAIMMMIGK